jgi:fumarate reductase flavoprotein subunit
MEDRLDRRSFIKGVTLTGVALASTGMLQACNPKPSGSSSSIKWDKEADVVIVGGGGTAVVAALEAANKGVSVLMLEKEASLGGNTIISSGVIQAAGTKFQKEFTEYQDDNPEKHYEYWSLAAEGITDSNLVKAMANGAPDCVDWLEQQGITYINVYGVAPIPYIDEKYMADRIHVPGGGENNTSGWGKFHMDTLISNAQVAGVEIITDSPVQKLIFDDQFGVIGVVANIDGKTINVKANKGVVMASGGYDRNKDMAQQFSPHQLWALETGVSYCALGNFGDGIRMGMEIGADLAGLGGTIGLPTTNVGIAPTLPGNLIVTGIMVNNNGLRFVAEDNHYGYVMRKVFNQESHLTWQIWDQSAMDLGGAAVSGISMMSEDMSKEISDGVVVKSETIRGLAESIGVNADNLENTINKWNEDMASSGRDTVWGAQLGLSPMDNPPYYAVKVVEYNLGTIGGLRINGDCQVLNTNGKVIPRLYAGGQTAGGFMGPYYPGTGTGVISTVYFGRIAGQKAADETVWSA